MQLWNWSVLTEHWSSVVTLSYEYFVRSERYVIVRRKTANFRQVKLLKMESVWGKSG